MFDSFRSRVADARESNQLFFAALIPAERIASMFGEASAILDSARVYTTAVTVWTLLTQVLSSDHGCVSAVAKLIAFRASNDQSIPSSKTGAYCIARDKLDEDAMHRVLCQTGEAIDERTKGQAQHFRKRTKGQAQHFSSETNWRVSPENFLDRLSNCRTLDFLSKQTGSIFPRRSRSLEQATKWTSQPWPRMPTTTLTTLEWPIQKGSNPTPGG